MALSFLLSAFMGFGCLIWIICFSPFSGIMLLNHLIDGLLWVFLAEGGIWRVYTFRV